MADAQSPANMNALKRKRSSPGITSPVGLPQNKVQKTNNVQINYLARQSTTDLPLIKKYDPMHNILEVLSSYSSVLDRHESLASNLGAVPLGPILIKRFERCFDAPPEIIASHSHAREGADSLHVTWLEVIQFAQSHPGQFTLSTFSEGRRVCQFYYPQKQVRLQVSEEDYLFIKSGRCQDLIPVLPIWEDEEKEVGTCEILEKQLKEVTNVADTVAARTRQLSHRLKSRRMAIMERRAGEKSGETRSDAEHDSVHEITPDNSVARPSPVPGQGFTAVNGQSTGHTPNGAVESTAPLSVRSELLRHFHSLSQNQPPIANPRRPSVSASSPTQASAGASTNNHYQLQQEAEPSASQSQPQAQAAVPSQRPDPLSYHLSEPNPPPAVVHNRVPSNHTSSQGKHNFSRPLAPGQEVSQPFRPACQALMESLPRGARVMPPCDRCRRLKMDCLKNLTSCQGCTKKHARCHWKDVDRSEVEGLEGIVNLTGEHDLDDEDDEDEDMAALEDLEALGREDDDGSHSPGGSDSTFLKQTSNPAADAFQNTLPFDEPAIQDAESAPTQRASSASPRIEPTQTPTNRTSPPRPASAFAFSGFTSVNNNLPRALTAEAQQPSATPATLAQEPKDNEADRRSLSPFSAAMARPPPPQQPEANNYSTAPTADALEEVKAEHKPRPAASGDAPFSSAATSTHAQTNGTVPTPAVGLGMGVGVSVGGAGVAGWRGA